MNAHGYILSVMLLSGLLASCSSNNNVETEVKKEAVQLQKMQQDIQCVLSGKVIFGPMRPVEREGMPKPDMSKMYAGRSVIIYSTNPKKIVAQLPLPATGRFECPLEPGEYIVDMKLRVPERSADLPKQVKLEEGETLNLEIKINTGMQ